MVQALVEEAEQKDLQQNSFTPASFGDRMLELKREALEGEERNHLASKRAKPSTIAKYRSLIVPQTVETPSLQNERRRMVRSCDVY